MFLGRYTSIQCLSTQIYPKLSGFVITHINCGVCARLRVCVCVRERASQWKSLESVIGVLHHLGKSGQNWGRSSSAAEGRGRSLNVASSQMERYFITVKHTWKSLTGRLRWLIYSKSRIKYVRYQCTCRTTVVSTTEQRKVDSLSSTGQIITSKYNNTSKRCRRNWKERRLHSYNLGLLLKKDLKMSFGFLFVLRYNDQFGFRSSL